MLQNAPCWLLCAVTCIRSWQQPGLGGHWSACRSPTISQTDPRTERKHGLEAPQAIVLWEIQQQIWAGPGTVQTAQKKQSCNQVQAQKLFYNSHESCHEWSHTAWNAGIYCTRAGILGSWRHKTNWTICFLRSVYPQLWISYGADVVRILFQWRSLFNNHSFIELFNQTKGLQLQGLKLLWC